MNFSIRLQENWDVVSSENRAYARNAHNNRHMR